MKQRVNVSRRMLKDGVESLYLDYRINGRRVRENLKLYIYKEENQSDKLKNNETIRIANAIRDKREFELEQMEAGVEVQSRVELVKFADYARKLIARKKNPSNASYKSIITILDRFRPNVYITEMDYSFFASLIKELIDAGYTSGTIRNMMAIAISTLHEAEREGKLSKSPIISGLLPKMHTTIREYLTIDELRKLDATECVKDDTKKAFLFCCFTGLRHCDVRRLTPSMISDNVISLRQRKTSEPVRIPLTENAKKYLPKTEGNKPYFNLSDITRLEAHIKSWVKRAGIDKRITFHCSRHTFAVLALSNGADIYVVSQLLGHTDVKTTQIYAKAVDSARKKAVNLIPEL